MRIHSSLLHFRFLRNVSVLLFLNKIDVLAEKVSKGRCIAELVKKYPHIFPDFDSFQASSKYKQISQIKKNVQNTSKIMYKIPEYFNENAQNTSKRMHKTVQRESTEYF